MARITIKEAVEITPVSESTLRRDIRSGKVSSEKNERGRRCIDTAELVRVYGQLTQPTHSNDSDMTAVDTPNDSPVNTNDPPDTPIDDPKIVALLENQIADLKTQLALASDRETALQSEKSKLLDMLSAEQEKTRVLMLPNPEEEERKEKGWLLRLIGAR